MSMTKECKMANKKAQIAPALVIVGHLIMVLAIIFLFTLPVLTLAGFIIMMVIGGLLSIISLYLFVMERRACGLV